VTICDLISTAQEFLNIKYTIILFQLTWKETCKYADSLDGSSHIVGEHRPCLLGVRWSIQLQHFVLFAAILQTEKPLPVQQSVTVKITLEEYARGKRGVSQERIAIFLFGFD